MPRRDATKAIKESSVHASPDDGIAQSFYAEIAYNVVYLKSGAYWMDLSHSHHRNAQHCLPQPCLH